jgi:hypothetical protein
VKEQFRTTNFRPDSLAKIRKMVEIVDEAAMVRVKAREESDKDRLRDLVDSIT